MRESPNLGLHLTSDEDKALQVSQWVERQTGDSGDSNMMKLDAAVGDVQKEIEDHGADRGNPHGVTAAQAQAIPAAQKGVAGGVAALDSAGKVPEAQLPDLSYDPLGSADSVRHELQGHTLATNPHNVTAAQVGLGNVDDTRDEEKPLSQAVRDALAALEAKIEIAAASGQKKLVATFTEDGIFRPADYGLENQYVDVYMVGGGAGGNGYNNVNTVYAGGGGGGGYCKLYKNILLSDYSYSIIVGAGGTGGYGTSNTAWGTPGGSTEAFGFIVSGGGVADDLKQGGDGGSGGGGGGMNLSNYYNGLVGEGGTFGSDGGSGYYAGGKGAGNLDYQPVNPYDNIPYGCGGGGAGSMAGGTGGGAGGRGGALGVDSQDAALGGGGGGGRTPGLLDGGNGGQGGGGGGGAWGNSTAGNGGAGIVYIYA